MHTWARYVAQDRRRALARGASLPELVEGSALFADIVGFTPLTERLVRELGARLGAEELTRRIDAVYELLIGACESAGGSVVGFAGDALICWFDGIADSARRAVRCAEGMQRSAAAFDGIRVKVAIGSGTARRFVAGDPRIQLLDALGGAAVARMSVAAELAAPGDIVVDTLTGTASQGSAVRERRVAPGGESCFVMATAHVPDDATPDIDGAPIAAAGADPARDMFAERLRPWLLQQVYEAERSGHAVFLAELRPTVALFLRFDGIAYDDDPLAAQQLDVVVRRAQAVAQRHEGTLLQLTLGDKGSYAYLSFGAPVAHEDDAARAMRAAWQLREALQPLAFLSTVQIGIAPGISRSGAYGSRQRATYGALGDGVNLAARLMSAASNGQILLAAPLSAAAGREFLLDAPLTLALKGRSVAVEARALGAPLPRQAMQLPEAGAELPMIGRHPERMQLELVVDAALQGRAQLIGIVGEAGIGKSRLVAELTACADTRGFAIFGAACSASGTTAPYLVWKPICRALLELDAVPHGTTLGSVLEARLADLAPHRLAALPVLAPVLDEPIADNEFTRLLAAEDRRNLLAATIEDMLKAMATRRPLLVVLEDLHWIDALSAQLLQTLTSLRMDVPLCFATTSRDAEGPGLPRQGAEDVVLIALGSLAADEARELVRRTLQWPATRQAEMTSLADALNARAEGNPFYLEELLSFVLERGLSEIDPTTLTPELPGSLHALILSRIDRLSEAQRATLKTASIIGRVFRVEWLQGCHPSLGVMAQIKADLDALRTMDITPLATPEPELSYLFKHIVIRDVAYESLPHSTRAQLHEQLGEFIEKLGGEPDLNLLAHHYGHSDRLDKQREYFRRAGDAAQAAYANDAALAYYDRLAPLLDAPRERFDVQLHRAGVLAHVGRSEEAVAVLRDALALAQADLDEGCVAEAAPQLGELLVMRGRYDEAHALLRRAAATWAALGAQRRQGEALVRDAMVHRGEGQPAQAVAVAECAGEIARAGGDLLTQARALAVLGWGCFALGQPQKARHSYEEALALARALGDRRQTALALQDLAVLETRQGRFAQARQLYEDCLELARQIGLKHTVDTVNLYYGTLLKEHGDHADAHVRLERAVEAFSAGGSKPHLAMATTNLGTNAMSLGEYETAERHLEAGLAAYRALGITGAIAWTTISLGTLHLLRGRLADARRLLLEALQTIAGTQDTFGRILGILSIASLLAEGGHLGNAVRLIAAAQHRSTETQFRISKLNLDMRKAALASARALLGPDEFERAWEEGSAQSLDQAVALALRAATDLR